MVYVDARIYILTSYISLTILVKPKAKENVRTALKLLLRNALYKHIVTI
jgi:hypothetical protein